jgi:hypothetical protein
MRFQRDTPSSGKKKGFGSSRWRPDESRFFP